MDYRDLSQLDLNLLHTMRAFVDTGGVAAAGRALGRSQPAISARLHQLEADLGVTLFERRGRRLHLTPVGRAVDADARELLGGIQRIIDRARGTGTDARGLVRIGALPTVGERVLAPILGSFCTQHPGVDIELEYGLGPQTLQGLVEGRLDLVASVGAPPQQPDLTVLELQRVEPVLVAPASMGHLPDPCAVADVAGLPFIGVGKAGDAFYDAVWAFVEANQLHQNMRVQVRHIQTMQALAASGAGVCVVPDYTVAQPGLCVRHVAGLDFSQPLWLAHRRTAATIPVIAALLAAVMG